MASRILVEIVTTERLLYSDAVDMVLLPGTNGQMGVLSGHAPLLTTLDIGEIVLHRGEDTEFLAVSGGVAEVRPDKVTILADTAERLEEIDAERALEARERANQLLATNPPPSERPAIEAALRRSTLRLKLVRRHQGRRRTTGLSFEEE